MEEQTPAELFANDFPESIVISRIVVKLAVIVCDQFGLFEACRFEP